MIPSMSREGAPESAQPAALGIDVGGHGIRGVLVDSTGSILASEQVTLDSEGERSVRSVEDKVAALVAQLDNQHKLAFPTSETRTTELPIGLGIPGFQDRRSQVVRSSPNFPEWLDVPVGQRFSQRLGRPVTVENDANCALLGEAWTGAARTLDDVVLLTLGTGVGTGFLVDGALVRGSRGAGAEGGHIGLHPRGRLCGCGRLGCLESYVSGPGLVATAHELWSSRGAPEAELPTTAHEVFQQVSRGSTMALEAMEQWCDDLGRGLASLIHIFAPEAVVLSGGLAASFDQFQAPVEAALSRHAIAACSDGLLPLRCGQLGPMAGAVGAASSAINPSRRQPRSN